MLNSILGVELGFEMNLDSIKVLNLFRVELGFWNESKFQ